MAKKTCAYCERPATTKDHVPPKALFPRPRPSDLITVPSCAACNNCASIDDERFNVMISIAVGAEEPQAERLFEQCAIPSTRHNRRLYRDFVMAAERVYLASPGGVIYDEAYKVRWDTFTADRVQSRMARALYHHHAGSRLPDSDFKVRFFEGVPDHLLKLGSDMPLGADIGDKQFSYRGMIESGEEEISSALMFLYYGRSLHAVTTRSVHGLSTR